MTDHLVQTLKTDDDISIISEEIFDHDPLTRIQNLKVGSTIVAVVESSDESNTYMSLVVLIICRSSQLYSHEEIQVIWS